MEATVAERGQITLPKAVRDALGLTKGRRLEVEREGGWIVLGMNVGDAFSPARGAHALLQCDGLIPRAAGFLRDCFKGLKLIIPRPA